MSYIFMDESGCLGFDFSKTKTSKYFVITFLFAHKKRPLEKIVKKIFRSMPEKVKRRHSGALHCNKEQPKVRLKLFSELNTKQHVSIMTIYLNKRNVYTKLQNEKPVLYNYITNILLDRIFTKKLIPLDEKIFLLASRRETNKFLNDNFRSYLERQVGNNHGVDIEIAIKTPHEEKGLQVVDFVSWAMFRKYEHQDDSYYNTFSDLIVEEKPLFG